MKHELAGNFFKVATVGDYEALQKALFAKGCSWSNGTDLKNHHFLQDVNDYQKGYACISVNDDGAMWRDADGVEGQISYLLTVSPAVREKVTVNGKTYNLDELLEAIEEAGIEEVAE